MSHFKGTTINKEGAVTLVVGKDQNARPERIAVYPLSLFTVRFANPDTGVVLDNEEATRLFQERGEAVLIPSSVEPGFKMLVETEDQMPSGNKRQIVRFMEYKGSNIWEVLPMDAPVLDLRPEGGVFTYIPSRDQL